MKNDFRSKIRMPSIQSLKIVTCAYTYDIMGERIAVRFRLVWKL